jgi:hypothetical protein
VSAESHIDPAILEEARALFTRIIEYGRVLDESVIGDLQAAYGDFASRAPFPLREEMLTRAIELCEQQVTSSAALYPFLFVDRAPQIISGAALHALALWQTCTTEQPLAGVDDLLMHARQLSTHDESRTVAILGGMLSFGDRRVLERMHGCWRMLTLEGATRLAATRAVRVDAPFVEFLIEWLEECEGAEYAAVAGSLAFLANCVRQGEPPYDEVLEVTRALPTWSTAPDDVLRVTNQWRIEEYAERIRARLESLAARETEPRVLPDVLFSWGLAPDPELVSHSNDTTLRLRRLPNDVITESTALGGAPIALRELLQWRSELLVQYAVFNPYGPTWMAFGVTEVPPGDTRVLWYLMVNPFVQTCNAIGTIVGQRSPADLDRALSQALSTNRIHDDLDAIGAIPDLLILGEVNADAVYGSLLVSSAFSTDALAEWVGRRRMAPGEPWKRIDQSAEEAQTLAPESRTELFSAWWQHAQEKEPVVLELVAFAQAWHGAIQFQRGMNNTDLADGAMGYEQMADLLQRLGFGFFAQILSEEPNA